MWLGAAKKKVTIGKYVCELDPLSSLMGELMNVSWNNKAIKLEIGEG